MYCTSFFSISIFMHDITVNPQNCMEKAENSPKLVKSVFFLFVRTSLSGIILSYLCSSLIKALAENYFPPCSPNIYCRASGNLQQDSNFLETL